MSKRATLFFLVFMVIVNVSWYGWGYQFAHRAVSPNLSVNYSIISVDNFYNEETQEYSGESYSNTVYSLFVRDRVGETLLIKNTFEVFTLLGDQIISLSRNYAINSITGEHVPELGDQPRSGYLTAPPHLEEGEPFTYWHINYDAPAHMEYVGTEEIQGMRVYRYFTTYQDEVIEQTSQLTYLPGVPENRRVLLEPQLTLWVEPETGMIVTYKDETIAYYYDRDTGEKLFPWNKFSNTFDEATVTQNVEQIYARKFMFLLQDHFVPFLLLILTLLPMILLLLPEFVLSKLRTWLVEKPWQQLLSLLVIIVAVLVLIGWAMGIEVLTSVIPGLVTMKVSTAISFVLSGSILFLGANSKLRYGTVASIVLPITTFLLAIIMGTLLVTSLAEISIGFESILIVEKTHQALFSRQPGIPSNGTIVAFFLVAVVGVFSLLHMNNYYKSLLYQSIGVLLCIIASLAFIGYVLDIPVLYYYVQGVSTAMAIHTSFLFFLLGITSWVSGLRNPDVDEL